jgi:hypothetical protein
MCDGRKHRFPTGRKHMKIVGPTRLGPLVQAIDLRFDQVKEGRRDPV